MAGPRFGNGPTGSHSHVEVNHRGGIAVLPQNSFEEPERPGALGREHQRHALARVHEECQDQRKIGFLRKMSNRLRPPVFFETEVIGGETLTPTFASDWWGRTTSGLDLRTTF